MNLPLTPPAKPGLHASPVVELRQYTLKPGRREALIGIFDGHLIEDQEAAGMTIIGQFRDLDRPDMFVWLRGFDGMEARKERADRLLWRADLGCAPRRRQRHDDRFRRRAAAETGMAGRRLRPVEVQRPSRFAGHGNIKR